MKVINLSSLLYIPLFVGVALGAGCQPATDVKYLVNIYGSGASIAQCYGFIISQDTVITAAQCVFGFKNNEISVCTKLSETCPQDPVNCVYPDQVYIHNNYYPDLLRGEVTTPLALLRFKPNFFRKSQLAPFDLSKECQCLRYANSPGETFDCLGDNGVMSRDLLIDDFTNSGSRYGYVDPLYSLFYTETTEEPFQCVGLPGAPLLHNGTIIGMNIYCQKNCMLKSFSVFICLVPFEAQFSRFETVFIQHEILLEKLEALDLPTRVNLRRYLFNYDETAECPRVITNSIESDMEMETYKK